MYLQKIENYQGEKMKTIHINSRQLKKYNKLKLSKDIPNTESIIYEMSKEKLLKLLFVSDEEDIKEKLSIIKLLSKYKKENNLNELVVPEMVAKSDGLTGFIMPLITGKNLGVLLKDESKSVTFKLIQLEKIGYFLKKIHSIKEEFHFGDLHPYNIIVTKKDLKFIDLDCSYLGNTKIFPSMYVVESQTVNRMKDKYKKNDEGWIIPSTNTDLYCYNMMILEFISKKPIYKLSKIEFKYYINYLKEIGFDKKLLEAFSRIYENEENINPVDLLETLTEEKILKANYDNLIKKRKTIKEKR